MGLDRVLVAEEYIVQEIPVSCPIAGAVRIHQGERYKILAGDARRAHSVPLAAAQIPHWKVSFLIGKVGNNLLTAHLHGEKQMVEIEAHIHPFRAARLEIHPKIEDMTVGLRQRIRASQGVPVFAVCTVLCKIPRFNRHAVD